MYDPICLLMLSIFLYSDDSIHFMNELFVIEFLFIFIGHCLSLKKSHHRIIDDRIYFK